jgi:RNA polymerase sigma factor (sigma-70 family)
MVLYDSMPSLVPLFGRLRDHDPEALNDILTHCQKQFLRLTKKMLGDFSRLRPEWDTDAVYNQASIRLIEDLRDVPFDSPKDFLCLAAYEIRRTLIDLTKRKKVVGRGCGGDPGSGPDPLGEAADGSTNSPDKLAMLGEFHDAVAAAPEDERVLFDLLYYQGLSLPEVSALLGVPLSTLKARWQAARANLMRRLKNETPV